MRIIALLLAMLAAPTGVFAQSACPGRMSANALAPLPPTAVLIVRAPGEEEANKALQHALFAALRRNGFAIGTPATHSFTWRGNLAEPAGGAEIRSDLSIPGDRNFSRENDQYGWSRSSALANREGTEPTIRFNASAELREIASGKVIWSAQLTCARASTDRAALIGALVNVVVPAIGKSIRDRLF